MSGSVGWEGWAETESTGGGGGDLVPEETYLKKFSTPNSGAIFPITFNDCGAIFPDFFLDTKFKICTLCWGVYDRGGGGGARLNTSCGWMVWFESVLSAWLL